MSFEYRIPRIAAPDWAAIPHVELAETGWLMPVGIRAWAQACHDGENLYVRLEAQETKIRAEETEKLDQICNDSCLEFFFAPDVADARYFNFEWNPLGNLYFGFGAERKTRVRQIVRDPQAVFGQKTFYTRGGWGVTFHVPASLIRMYFPGFVFAGEASGNFYKCGDMTETPHYLAWNPLTCDTPDYHRRGDFGRLVFE